MFGAYITVIKGAGDLATGCAIRLSRCGFPVIMTEVERPLAVRRTVSFSEAVYSGQIEVEGTVARHVADAAAALEAARAGEVPVIVDPRADVLRQVEATIVIDAIMAKQSPPTALADAPLVVGLGPGFEAGRTCHAVVETNRGHNLGRVYWHGSAEPDTGVPGSIGGYTTERLLRAPEAGIIRHVAAIGDVVRAHDLVATVGGVPVDSPIEGVLRGLIHEGIEVSAGLKIGDVDPRAKPEHCFTISDKARAVAGGALEAVLVGLRLLQSGQVAAGR